jgi:hypothetical protein
MNDSVLINKYNSIRPLFSIEQSTHQLYVFKYIGRNRGFEPFSDHFWEWIKDPTINQKYFNK